MKKLILSLLLAPFLSFSQGPSFNITDNNGNVWDSDSLLEQGTTIIVQFFTPSMTCWPSSNAVENIASAYEKYKCNDILFIQVAQWGNEQTVYNFMEEFANLEIPYVSGTEGGSDMTWDWMDVGLQWAYECWVLWPNGEYIIDLEGQQFLDQEVLIDLLEQNNFKDCNEHETIGIEEIFTPQENKTIYDLQGRILNEKPIKGIYIQGNKIYIK